VSNIITDIIDYRLPIGGVIRQFPYIIGFKTTKYCFLQCAHCCENAGPDQAKTFIPVQSIFNILKSAKQDPLFTNSVIFTGGEIFSSYFYSNEKYVPDLLSFAAKNKIDTDIKTNAVWAKSKYFDAIMSDIENVVANNPEFLFQISLSIDRFHHNCIENNVRLISALTKMRGKYVLNISSFTDDSEMCSALINALRRESISVTPGKILSNNKSFDAYMVGQDVLMFFKHSAQVRAAGRGIHLDNAKKLDMDWLSFMSPDHQVIMVFDVSGRVILGESGPDKISARWLKSNGNVRTLADVRHDLIRNARYKEFVARIRGCIQ
jgi:hypothetical protein